LIHQEAGKGEPILISLLVLLEMEWVLRSRYALAKAEILTAFAALLDAAGLAFEDEASVEEALYCWKDSAADFADCLINAAIYDWAAALQRPSMPRYSNYAV
jgi:predicted nucleic-acid-binding protein